MNNIIIHREKSYIRRPKLRFLRTTRCALWKLALMKIQNCTTKIVDLDCPERFICLRGKAYNENSRKICKDNNNFMRHRRTLYTRTTFSSNKIHFNLPIFTSYLKSIRNTFGWCRFGETNTPCYQRHILCDETSR